MIRVACDALATCRGEYRLKVPKGRLPLGDRPFFVGFVRQDFSKKNPWTLGGTNLRLQIAVSIFASIG
jgi:hypothetical protein